ncbi:MAG: SWIM zinc finger family protein, partial [Steroidobacteraceae bacterium]
MKRQRASDRPIKEPKLTRAHPPVDLAPADWQRALRRQFGRDQAFVLENRGDRTFFSEFRVSNPQSKASYRVAIRGLDAGDNYCSCQDYATNELGTCKHIEFVLARLQKKRGAKAAFAKGWRPAFSEIYLRNDGARAVYFRAGSDCPPAVIKAAARLFDAARGGVLPEERFGELEHFLATAAKSGHELRAYDDALDFVAGRRDAARRAEVLDSLFPRGAADKNLAKLLEASLYPYQAEGALFA